MGAGLCLPSLSLVLWKGRSATSVSTQCRSLPIAAACISHSHQEKWQPWAGKPQADGAAVAEGTQMRETHIDLWQLD